MCLVATWYRKWLVYNDDNSNDNGGNENDNNSGNNNNNVYDVRDWLMIDMIIMSGDHNFDFDHWSLWLMPSGQTTQ